MSAVARALIAPLIITLVGFLGGLPGIYVMNRLAGNDSPAQPPCAGALKAARTLSGVADRTLAGVTFAREPTRVSELRLVSDKGATTLETWRGRWVLVNAWAE